MRHPLNTGVRRGLVLLALAELLACNSKNESESPANTEPKGHFTCQTTREDCIEVFQGTYSGTFSGDASGTFTVYIAPDGTIEGVVTDADGNSFTVTGSVDETGVVVFSAAEPGSFEGSIDFEENLTGTWSGQPGAGSFTGSFVSRDRDLPSATSTGAGGTTSTTGSTTTGGQTTYCDRLTTKAVECDSVGEGECSEPTDDDQRCAAQCLLDLTCEQIEQGDPLFDCFTRCTADGERSYCLEYQDKLTECNKEDTLLLLDICGASGTPEQTCVWDCVLDATCEAFMDEANLVQSCSSDCSP